MAQIGGAMEAGAEIDAMGLLILPGGLDAHVHLPIPPGEVGDPQWVDDLASGPAAALAGIITTLGDSRPREGDNSTTRS